MSYLTAVDDDAGIFGDVDFEVSSDNGDDHQNFEILKVDRKQSELRATRKMDERTYVVSENSNHF